MKPFIIAILLVPALAGPAEARHPKPEPPTLIERLAGAVQGFARTVARAAATSAAAAGDAAREAPGRLRAASYEVGDEEIVPNPPGCPPRLFCGCGVSVKVYGHPVPELYAAASWRRFPQAECGRGRVAVYSGHVAYILDCHGDGTALAYDPNSGGHQTRIHAISLAGATIVDPKGD